jgi:phage tail-like protein
MARSRIADFMQNHRFWLLDVVPSTTFPYLVLGAPLMGFQSITTPEYTAEVDEIKQLNSMFKRTAYSGGGVSPITLTRGVLGYDDTMWQWMKRAIQGFDTTNRHLLLIQYTSVSIDPNSQIGTFVDELPGPWESRSFLPGKAWLLWDACPTRYKAGTDFDAQSGQVSIAELEINYWAVTELSLLSPL